MHQLTVSFDLDEQVYKILSRYAAVVHLDIGTIVGEIVTKQLAELTLRVEQEQTRALPLAIVDP